MDQILLIIMGLWVGGALLFAGVSVLCLVCYVPYIIYKDKKEHYNAPLLDHESKLHIIFLLLFIGMWFVV